MPGQNELAAVALNGIIIEEGCWIARCASVLLLQTNTLDFSISICITLGYKAGYTLKHDVLML